LVSSRLPHLHLPLQKVSQVSFDYDQNQINQANKESDVKSENFQETIQQNYCSKCSNKAKDFLPVSLKFGMMSAAKK
jgi:hypothetical protein